MRKSLKRLVSCFTVEEQDKFQLNCGSSDVSSILNNVLFWIQFKSKLHTYAQKIYFKLLLTYTYYIHRNCKLNSSLYR